MDGASARSPRRRSASSTTFPNAKSARKRAPVAGRPPGDLGVAIDRTRPRPSGARGVIKWAKPKPAVPRGSNRSEAGARLGAEDSFSGDSAPWWDGIGVAKALRARLRDDDVWAHRLAGSRAEGPGARSDPPARRRALRVVAAAC